MIVIVHFILNPDTRFYIWGSGCLLTDISFILIFNSCIVPALYIFHFGLIGKLFKRCNLKRHNGHKYTQKQAHNIEEGADIDPIRSYTDIYQIFLTSMFFVEAFPANTLIHCGSLIVIYWLQKTYLLRIFARPKLLQSQICMDTLFLIKVGVFVNTAGQMYFDSILRGEIHGITIGQFVVSAIMIFVPIEDMFLDLYNYSTDEATVKKDLTYDHVSASFISEFDRENPATAYEASKEFKSKKGNAPSHHHGHSSHPHKPHQNDPSVDTSKNYLLKGEMSPTDKQPLINNRNQGTPNLHEINQQVQVKPSQVMPVSHSPHTQDPKETKLHVNDNKHEL